MKGAQGMHFLVDSISNHTQKVTEDQFDRFFGTTSSQVWELHSQDQRKPSESSEKSSHRPIFDWRNVPFSQIRVELKEFSRVHTFFMHSQNVPYLYDPICMNSTLFYDVNSWILRWKELFNWYSKRWESYIWIEMSEHLMDWTEITRITCMIIGNKVGFITGNCGKLDIYHRCRSFSRY